MTVAGELFWLVVAFAVIGLALGAATGSRADRDRYDWQD